MTATEQVTAQVGRVALLTKSEREELGRLRAKQDHWQCVELVNRLMTVRTVYGGLQSDDVVRAEDGNLWLVRYVTRYGQLVNRPASECAGSCFSMRVTLYRHGQEANGNPFYDTPVVIAADAGTEAAYRLAIDLTDRGELENLRRAGQ